MDRHTQAYIYALVAVLLWSTVASAFKLTLRYMDVFQMLFYASAVSTTLLFVILAVQGKLGLFRTFSLGQYSRSLVLGLLSPSAYYMILFQAYSLLPAQEAQSLNMIWPVLIVLLSAPMLGQSINRFAIFAMLVSFSGTYIISTHGDLLGFNLTSVQGTVMALGSAFLWALYWISNMQDERDAVVKLFLSFLSGLAFIVIGVTLFSDFHIQHIRGLLGAGYIGAFEMGITFVVWSKALSMSKTTAHVSHLIFLVPFLSLVFIYLVLDERILGSTIVGLLFVVGGILLRGIGDRRETTGKRNNI